MIDFSKNPGLVGDLITGPWVPGQVDLLMGLPGVGKTTAYVIFHSGYLKDHPDYKILILSSNHNFLTNEITRMFKGNGWEGEIRHWKGMRKICPKPHPYISTLLNRQDKIAVPEEDMDDNGEASFDIETPELSSGYICAQCVTMQRISIIKLEVPCPHKAQFENLPQITIAPIDYCATGLVDPEEFDLIIVDDSPFKPNQLLSPKKVNTMLQELGLPEYSYEKMVEELEQLITSGIKEKDAEPEVYKLLGTAYKNWWQPKYFIDEEKMGRETMTANMLNTEEHLRKAKLAQLLLNTAPVRGLLKVAKLMRRFGEREQFYETSLQYLFGFASKTRVLFVDAFPNIDFMNSLIDHYKKIRVINKYTKLAKPLELPWVKNPDSVVYRIVGGKHGKRAWWPISSFEPKNIGETGKLLAPKFQMIFDKHKGEKIGLITFKKVCGEAKYESRPRRKHRLRKLFTTEQLRALGCRVSGDQVFGGNIMHYGDLRGSNKLEECDVVILLGTYVTNMNALRKYHNGVFVSTPEISKEEMKDLSARAEAGNYRYELPTLEYLRQVLDDGEMLQSSFRGRPLNHKCTTYAFSAISPRAEEWLDVKYCSMVGDGLAEMGYLETVLIKYLQQHEMRAPDEDYLTLKKVAEHMCKIMKERGEMVKRRAMEERIKKIAEDENSSVVIEIEEREVFNQLGVRKVKVVSLWDQYG